MQSRGMYVSWVVWCAVYLALSMAFFSDARTHAAALNDDFESGQFVRLLYQQERWLWLVGLVLAVVTTALWLRAFRGAEAANRAKIAVLVCAIAAVTLATVALQSTPSQFLGDASGQGVPEGLPDEVAAKAGWLALLAFGLVLVVGVAVSVALRARRQVAAGSAAT